MIGNPDNLNRVGRGLYCERELVCEWNDWIFGLAPRVIMAVGCVAAPLSAFDAWRGMMSRAIDQSALNSILERSAPDSMPVKATASWGSYYPCVMPDGEAVSMRASARVLWKSQLPPCAFIWDGWWVESESHWYVWMGDTKGWVDP